LGGDRPASSPRSLDGRDDQRDWATRSALGRPNRPKKSVSLLNVNTPLMI